MRFLCLRATLCLLWAACAGDAMDCKVVCLNPDPVAISIALGTLNVESHTYVP